MIEIGALFHDHNYKIKNIVEQWLQGNMEKQKPLMWVYFSL